MYVSIFLVEFVRLPATCLDCIASALVGNTPAVAGVPLLSFDEQDALASFAPFELPTSVFSADFPTPPEEDAKGEEDPKMLDIGAQFSAASFGAILVALYAVTGITVLIPEPPSATSSAVLLLSQVAACSLELPGADGIMPDDDSDGDGDEGGLSSPAAGSSGSLRRRTLALR